MNKIKLTYEQPSCELLVVRFEENIMSNTQNSVSSPSFTEDGEIDDNYSNSNWWNS